MEKYLIILVILATIYYIQSKLLIEGFEAAPAQSLGGVDDTNAINTLAQISKQLMAGGVTVPGNMTVQGNVTVTNNINLVNDMHTGGVLSSIGPDKKNKVCLHTPPDGRRALYIAPQKLDGSDWEWGNGLALDFKEKVFNTNSNSLIVGGNVSIGNDLIFPNQTTIKGAGRLHITGEELLYILNKKGVVIGKEWGGTGDLVVQGHIDVGGSIFARGGSRAIIIYPVGWGHAAWSEKMVAYFNKNEHDGIQKDFLLIHPGNNDPNHSHRWITRMTGIKLGRQVLFFQSPPEHHNVPNPHHHDSNDHNWRRNIP